MRKAVQAGAAFLKGGFPMLFLIGAITCILAVWLVVSPLLLGYSLFGIVASVLIGSAMFALGLTMAKKRTSPSLAKGVIALGAVAIICGIAALVLYGFGANLVVVGVVSLCLGVAALPFMVEAKDAKFYNKMGSDLARVTAVKTNKDGDITAKVVLLGSMPETIYVHPQELIKMLALMDDSVVKGIVGYIARGYKANKAQAAQAEKK